MSLEAPDLTADKGTVVDIVNPRLGPTLIWNSGVNVDTQRAVALVEARLGKAAYLFASFGKDYEERGKRTNLVSVVGINIGVGSKPLLTN